MRCAAAAVSARRAISGSTSGWDSLARQPSARSMAGTVQVMPYERLNSAYFRPAARTDAPLTPAATRRTSQVTEVTLRLRPHRRWPKRTAA